ncbi:hypothetical protein MHYP_G00324180 [Metynnis hypsauchen]
MGPLRGPVWPPGTGGKDSFRPEGGGGGPLPLPGGGGRGPLRGGGADIGGPSRPPGGGGSGPLRPPGTAEALYALQKVEVGGLMRHVGPQQVDHLQGEVVRVPDEPERKQRQTQG